MKRNRFTKNTASVFVLSALFIGAAQAADPLPDFVSGETLTADQLNTVKNAVQSNSTEIETTTENLQALDGVVNGNITAIEGKQNKLQSGCTADQAIQSVDAAGAVTCVDVIDPVGTFAPVDHNHDEAYYSKSEADSVFSKKVTNFASNSDYANGLAGWSVDPDHSTSTLQLVNVTGPLSDKAIQNDENKVLWATSDDIITIDHNQAYEVKGTFRRQAGGTTGAVYLAVKLMDAGGAAIGGDGQWWYYPVSNHVPPVDTWVEYKAQFGAGTSRPFPAEAVSATVGFILNYNEGDRIYQVQGLSMHTSNPNSGWSDLILNTNFTNYGGNYQTAQYRKTSDIVCLRGRISYSGGNNVSIAALPPTFRPSAYLNFYTGNAFSNHWQDSIEIRNNGDLVLLRDGSDNWITLDGICFSTSP